MGIYFQNLPALAPLDYYKLIDIVWFQAGSVSVVGVSGPLISP